jgi:hypothetical protein
METLANFCGVIPWGQNVYCRENAPLREETIERPPPPRPLPCETAQQDLKKQVNSLIRIFEYRLEIRDEIIRSSQGRTVLLFCQSLHFSGGHIFNSADALKNRLVQWLGRHHAFH